jgi:hypothetical protein
METRQGLLRSMLVDQDLFVGIMVIRYRLAGKYHLVRVHTASTQWVQPA